MRILETELEGVFIIEPRRFEDSRGVFFESFQLQRYQEIGIPGPFVQDNFSHSHKNVVRGLHYQLERPQGKLVFVAYGKVLDVIVDIRVSSATFGKAITIELSEQNGRQVYIPPGFAHGFCVVSETAGFIYKCTDYYHPASEKGVIWNDADLNITWPTDTPILAAKDQEYTRLKDLAQDQLFA